VALLARAPRSDPGGREPRHGVARFPRRQDASRGRRGRLHRLVRGRPPRLCCRRRRACTQPRWGPEGFGMAGDRPRCGRRASAGAASPTPAVIPGAGLFTASYLLSICIWVPVVVAVVIGLMPNPRGRYDTVIKQIAFFTNLGIMFVLFIAYNQFQAFLPNVQ